MGRFYETDGRHVAKERLIPEKQLISKYDFHGCGQGKL
jgi:hypothetical protein